MKVKRRRETAMSRTRRPGTRTNESVDRWGRIGAYRDWTRASSAPAPVQWVLSNPQISRKRFTDTQWAVLVARWPFEDFTWWPRNSTYNVGLTVYGETGHSASIRKEEALAQRMIAELCFLWRPAEEKRVRIRAGSGEELTDEEHRILTRQRKARPKKGRRKQAELEGIRVGETDAYDRWTSDNYAGPLRSADMSD
jgi:hypothetical protein